MSKEVLVCPWRAEQCVKTLWSAVGAIKHDDWTVAHCIKENCAMWGVIEHSTEYYKPDPIPADPTQHALCKTEEKYGCRRRG